MPLFALWIALAAGAVSAPDAPPRPIADLKDPFEASAPDARPRTRFVPARVKDLRDPFDVRREGRRSPARRVAYTPLADLKDPFAPPTPTCDGTAENTVIVAGRPVPVQRPGKAPPPCRRPRARPSTALDLRDPFRAR